MQITKNSGATWSVISNNLPQDLWVTRVIASKYKKERVYVTLNSYRNDMFKSYVYISEDFGATWKAITNGVASSPVNVIKEDLEDENILYLGTDNGAYVSLNKGENWNAFANNLPAVAVHDLVLQRANGDLLLGTHGRSIYKTNIEALQSYNANKSSQDITIFDLKPVAHSSRWGSAWSKWIEPNVPSFKISFYAKKNQAVKLEILSEEKRTLNAFNIKSDKGFNTFDYDVTLNKKGVKNLLKENTSIDIEPAKNGKSYLPKGNYFVRINGLEKAFEVK